MWWLPHPLSHEKTKAILLIGAKFSCEVNIISGSVWTMTYGNASLSTFLVQNDKKDKNFLEKGIEYKNTVKAHKME